jgi:hypothetical protein
VAGLHISRQIWTSLPLTPPNDERMEMTITRRQTTEEDVYKPPDINPHLRGRLPHIREELANKLIHLRPQLESAEVALGELRDFILFEIKKVRLRIEQQEWENVVNVQHVAVDKKWLQDLEDILTDFDSHGLRGSQRFIDGLLDRLDRVLGKHRL